MSFASYSCQFAVVQRIGSDVSLIVKQSIDTEAKVVCVVASVSLAVQNKLNNSGTNSSVEEGRLMKIESKS